MSREGSGHTTSLLSSQQYSRTCIVPVVVGKECGCNYAE